MTHRPRRESAGALLELLDAEVGVGLAVLDEDGRYLFANAAFGRLNVLPGSPGQRAPEVLSKHDETVVKGVIELARRAGVRVRAADIVRDGRSWEVSYVPLEVAGRFAVGVVASDTSGRDGALAKAEASASRPAALAEFSRMVVLAEDLAPVFDEAVALLVRELHVELAALLELVPGGLEFSLRASVGYRLPEHGSMIIPAGAASQAGYTLSVDEPVVVEDVATDARFSTAAVLVAHGARSGISVPIRAGAQLWGVLSTHTTAVRTFAAADVNTVRTVANVLGAALAREAATVELKGLALQRRRLAQEALESSDRERHRLADLVHDEVLQHLLFARQECAALLSAETEPVVARLRQSIDDATRLLRDAISDLHPITLAHVGLRVAVEALAQEYAARGGFQVSVRVADVRETPHDQLVIAAIRELLTNAVKHATASSVDVIVRPADGVLIVEVSDDGVGLDPSILRAAVAAGHIGLASVVERVEALGGSAMLTTASDGRGARVRLALPLA